MKRKIFSRSMWQRIMLAAAILVLAALMTALIARRTPPPQESAPPEDSLPPEETPGVEAEALARLETMTTREKICQLLILQPEYIEGAVGSVKTVTPALRNTLQDYPLGGVLLSVQNMDSADQLRALTAGFQDASAVPMLICVDEEGGEVSRLMVKVGTTRLNNMYSYRAKGPGVARLNAETIGADLAAFGFNTDFAPVADVWSNKRNEVIGERAYSDDFGVAAELVAAAVQGFHDSGTICCLKHFPGHGSTRADSHTEAAYVDATLDELRAQELLPFRSGIEAGADMVMVGHLTVPAVDSVPATYSRVLVTDVLRGELGFDGVVITDGLEMAAAGDDSDGEKALRALNAGCDLLLAVQDVPGTVRALEQALEDGTLSQQDLDAHVLRVLQLKLRCGLLPAAEE